MYNLAGRVLARGNGAARLLIPLLGRITLGGPGVNGGDLGA